MTKKPKDLSYGKKPPISLVPPEAIRECAKCMGDGASKRSPYNWRKDHVSAMQLSDKVLRHILDFIDGNDVTEDTKLSNLASAMADICVLIDAKANDCLVDDRPKIINFYGSLSKYEDRELAKEDTIDKLETPDLSLNEKVHKQYLEWEKKYAPILSKNNFHNHKHSELGDKCTDLNDHIKTMKKKPSQYYKPECGEDE